MIRISPEYSDEPDPHERDRFDAEMHATIEMINDLEEEKEKIFYETKQKYSSLEDAPDDESREAINLELLTLGNKYTALTKRTLELKKRLEWLRSKLGIKED